MCAKPENCIIVEDSETGVIAGLAAGMHVFYYTKLEKNGSLSKNNIVLFDNMLVLSQLIGKLSNSEKGNYE